MSNKKQSQRNRICCIYNMGAHYRWPIFSALARKFPIDFCLGPDNAYTRSIKTFDYNKLPGFKLLLRNRRLPLKFYWQSGAIRQLFAPYRQYLMLGEAYCLSSWVVVAGARLTGRKAVCWTHGWYGREGGMKRWVSRLFYSMFSTILTYNDYARRLLIEGGIPEEKIMVVGNSLDSAAHRAIRPLLKHTDVYSAHFHNALPTLIYCGRIQKSKRLDLLIEAARILKERGKDVNLVFVGKDSEDVDLPDMAKAAGIEDKVWFYGPCYDDGKLAELFYNAAVCVSPGNVGLTAVHALSFGCPVITHGDFPYQGPEFECIKPGITGDFFHRNDALSLALVIENWIGHTPAQRQQTIQAAYREIDTYWSVEHQLEVFSKVLITS